MAYIALLPILSALLWAITNHIDKYLISRLVKKHDFRGLMIFSSFVSGLLLIPFYAILTKLNVSIDLVSLIWMFLSSIMAALGIAFYYKALAKNDTSFVIVMFQLIPVVSFILGLLFLNETLTLNQLLGGSVIVLSAVAITFEFDKTKFSREKIISLLLMALSSICYSSYFLFFRFVSKDYDFNVVAFWSNTTLCIVGILLLLFKSYRSAFKDLVMENGRKALVLNVSNELMYSIGNLVVNYAALFTPIAVTMLAGSIQPIFVFIIGIALTIFLPKIAKEDISKSTLIQRSTCIAISVIGLFLLNVQ